MEIENYNEVVFESIKHIDDDGCEYWEARELQRALDYDKWDNFNKVIQKGIIACEKSGNVVLDHFPDVGKMVETGDSKRIISNYHLSRYACYLIAQNADSRKKVVALAQTYFATQTRKQEVLEEKYKNLSEDEKRILERKKVRNSIKRLGGTMPEDLPTPIKSITELDNSLNKLEN